VQNFIKIAQATFFQRTTGTGLVLYQQKSLKPRNPDNLGVSLFNGTIVIIRVASVSGMEC
jgi:hypothetical protein